MSRYPGVDLQGLDRALGLDHRLWTDGSAAPARVAQMHRSRRIDGAAMQALSDFIEKGFAIVRAALQRETLEAAWQDLDAALAQGLALTCHREGLGLFSSADVALSDLMRGHFAVHDLHQRSAACRAVLASEAIAGLLTLLFDGTPVLMQSQMMRHGSCKGTHTDFVHCPVARPLQTATVWIAADAADRDNGPLFVVPRSHRLPLHRFDNGAPLWPHGEDRDQLDVYHRALAAQCQAAGLRPLLFEAQPGDLILLHPRLAHGAQPSCDAGRSRRSFVLHCAAPEAYQADHRTGPGGSTPRLCGRVRYHHRHAACGP